MTSSDPPPPALSADEKLAYEQLSTFSARLYWENKADFFDAKPAWEQPGLFAAEMRDSFRSLR